MDKYQRVVLENNKKDSFYYCVSVKNGGGAPNTDFNYSTDVFTLTQDEDIFSTKYKFVLRANTNIETCFFYVNGEWHSANQKGTSFCIELDFENRVEKVKLTFADNIVDDYIFSVQYVEADKDSYYQKQAEAKRNTYIEAAQIKHSTGADLVNIYFQPCCSDYEYTEIYLYIPQDKATVGEPSSWQMFKKCKVPAEDFYKSINVLAYGTYAYVIKQFDKKDNLLLETEYIEFSLKAPKQPIMGRINII